jgi:hypothetical protein
MEYIFLTLASIGGGIYLILKRGRTTVKAAMFLHYLDEGLSIEDANNSIKGVSFSEASRVSSYVVPNATSSYNGSQLNMLAAARQRGFRE